MSLSSFTVCMNALRLNLVKIHDASRDRPMRRKAAPETAVPEEARPGAADDQQNIIPKEDKSMKETINVNGMMCMHCEMHVKKALEALDGVEAAAPDHNAGKVELTLSRAVDAAELKKAVEDAGYEFVG